MNAHTVAERPQARTLAHVLLDLREHATINKDADHRCEAAEIGSAEEDRWSDIGAAAEQRMSALADEAKAMIVASAEAPNHKPAFTQEQVDAMFKAPVPASKAINADVICEAISELDGVPLGHVALEVAARFKALASRETENASIRERF